MSLNRRRAAIAGGAAVLVVVPAAVILARGESPPPADSPSGGPAVAVERAEVAPDGLPDLVFAANQAEGFRLLAVEPDGTGRVELTGTRGMYPAWSPDGRRLAYVGEHEATTGTQLAVRVIEEDGTIRTVTTGTQVPSNLTYRTGGELYYEASLQATSGATGISSTTSIDAVATDGGNQRTAVYERGATYHPAWSPDGERLAYVSSRPRAACGAEGQERQRCDQPLVVRTGERSVDVVDRGIAANPAWSPDGEQIAFSWRKDRRLAIWLVEPGGQPVRVTEGRGEDEPTWSPDGRSIAFTRDCDVWVQEVEGGVARNVTTTPDICEISPAWRPGGER